MLHKHMGVLFSFYIFISSIIAIHCMELTATHNSADAVQEQLTFEEILERIRELQKISFNLRGQILGHTLSFETVPHKQHDDSTGEQSSKKSHAAHPTLPELATLLIQTEHQLDKAQATQEYIRKKYHEFKCTQVLNEIQRVLDGLITLKQKIFREQIIRTDESLRYKVAQLSISSAPEAPSNPGSKLKFKPFND